MLIKLKKYQRNPITGIHAIHLRLKPIKWRPYKKIGKFIHQIHFGFGSISWTYKLNWWDEMNDNDYILYDDQWTLSDTLDVVKFVFWQLPLCGVFTIIERVINGKPAQKSNEKSS